tara:strand:- start:347 stop:3469 length:3123 start_codon:yes stop_codon:yes gene_type:complete
MAGPWEKYATEAVAPVAGPWMKYQDAAMPVPPIPPETDEALAAEAAAIKMPNFVAQLLGIGKARPDLETVMPHTGKINPGTLPTTDDVRAAVEKWSVPEGPSIMGMAKNTLLGAMDIGQGRVRMNESGNPLSIRPTSESMDALGLAAGMSPAMGSGRAIAQTAEHGAPLADLYARYRPAASPPPPPPATPLVTALSQGMPAEMRVTAPRSSPLADALARSGQPEADRVFLPSGREVPVQYEVVDAGALRTSHRGDGSLNPDFPQNLQPRDRTRDASDLQINRIANNLQPERLGRSSSAMEGAPIIGPDGVVESGNARTIAIIRAYKRGDANAAGYRDYLTQQGYDIAGMERPVLIRRRQGDMTPDERARFAQEANAEVGLSMGAAERAATDATRLNEATLNLYRGGDIGSAENADFVRAFVGNVAERGQEGAISTAGGTLSADGAARMRNALTQKAYGDSALVAGLAETGDDAIRAFGGGMQDAAGSMAKLAGDIAQGRVDPAVDISKGLAEAVQAIKTARESRIPLRDVVGQRDAFGGGLSDQAETLLTAAYGPELRGRMNRRAFGEMLSSYARLASEQTPGPRLFGDNLGWRDLLKSAGARVADDGAPPALFGPVGSAAPGPSPARLAEALAGSEQRSVGAAGTPSNLTAMSAREAAASRATGERFQLMETARAGDATEYVPGVKPTLAEIEQNAGVSREAKTLRITNPTEIAERAADNAKIYADFLADMAGTESMLDRAILKRAEQATRELKIVWQDKMKANVQPVFDLAEAIKVGPDGRRGLVRTAIDKVVSEMKERDGSLTTDPELLYGARKNLDDLLSKEAKRQDALSVRAEAMLLSIKSALDDVIEAAAPGFKRYLVNFAEASKPIDVMRLLQKAELALGTKTANRELTFSHFDRFMRDLVEDRAAHGVNPAKSIDEATWEKLVAMHKSLQRTAAAELQARAPGSDTAANFYDMSKLGIRAAAHAVGALVWPGLGNVAAHLGANLLDKKSAAARLARHLDPDLSKYPQHDSPLARGLTNYGFKSDFPNNQTGP